MKTKHAGIKAVLDQIEQSPDRSTLFYWMVEQHDALVATAKGRRLRWVDLCVTFKALGLTNQRGEPATVETARMTWYRARKEVARQRAYVAVKAAAGLVPRSLMPSARPANWRPVPLASQPSAGANLGQARQSGPATSDRIGDTMPGVRGPVSPEVVRARKAALQRTLDERSGRQPLLGRIRKRASDLPAFAAVDRGSIAARSRLDHGSIADGHVRKRVYTIAPIVQGSVRWQGSAFGIGTSRA